MMLAVWSAIRFYTQILPPKSRTILQQKKEVDNKQRSINFASSRNNYVPNNDLEQEQVSMQALQACQQ